MAGLDWNGEAHEADEVRRTTHTTGLLKNTHLPLSFRMKVLGLHLITSTWSAYSHSIGDRVLSAWMKPWPDLSNAFGMCAEGR